MWSQLLHCKNSIISLVLATVLVSVFTRVRVRVPSLITTVSVGRLDAVRAVSVERQALELAQHLTHQTRTERPHERPPELLAQRAVENEVDRAVQRD